MQLEGDIPPDESGYKSMTKHYACAPVLQWSVIICIGTMGALLVWMISRGEMTFDAVMGFSVVGILGVWAVLEVNGTLQLDENGLTAKGWRGKSVLPWAEVADVQISPHMLSIATARRNTRIVLRHGEYAGIGIGLEPFDDLCQEVAKHTLPRLSKAWAQQGLPLHCRYPGITRGTVALYVIPLLLIMTFFTTFVTMSEGMLLEKVVFLLVGLLAIVPFWLRDHRKNRKTLILTTDGVKQTNGQNIFLAWSDIQEITLTEEPPGLGSIIVKGRNDQEIQIPRSLQNAGAILYWLKRYTNLSETSQVIAVQSW